MNSPLRSKNVSLDLSILGQRNSGIPTGVICKTHYHTIENFGNKVPVQVAEAIKFKERNAYCSASISDDGWAWFITGRRLFIWQASGRKHLLGNLCRELSLPPSDLAHKASLVSVFTSHGNQSISCIAVSPEGLIRYWPSIANEGISIEDNAELQGEECESINCILPLGFVVSTTTATILLVETNNIAGRHSLFCRPFAAPTGWIGGISRRMSSLFFGGILASHNMANKLVKVLVSESGSHLNTSIGLSAFNIYIATNSVLQKWHLLSGEQEKLLYECNIQRMVANNFLQIFWNDESSNPIEVTFLDIQQTGSGASTNLVMLVSAMTNSISSHVYYAFASINVGSDSVPVKINAFYPLRNIDFSLFHRDQSLSGNIKFLMVEQTTYLYNSKLILCIPVIGRVQEVDIIRIQDTLLLGGVIINQTPIFFSSNHGFVSVVATDEPSNDSVNVTLDSSSLVDLGGDILEPLSSDPIVFPKDNADGLKSAFLHFVSKRTGQAKAIINQTFPIDSGTNQQIDAALDTAAIKVSIDLINDIPAKDPRWNAQKSAERISITNITSLQILKQLKQKLDAWELFTSFLKETGLWNRFTAVTWNDVIMATTHVLSENAEKIIAAIAFRRLQTEKYSDIIDAVISQVIKTNNINQLPGLTVHDVFYKQVNIINEGMKQLCSYSRDYVHEMHSVQNITEIITTVNSILLDLIHEINRFRTLKMDFYAPSSQVMVNFGCEILPWTATPGEGGLRDSLLSQVNVAFKHGIRSMGNSCAKQEIFVQLVSFITFILEGWEIHIASIKNKPIRHNTLLIKYANERRTLIRMLVDEGEYEEATILSEKFQEFTILIEIFDKTGDTDRLEYYMDKFQEQDFPKFVFSYYIGKKQPGKLLQLFRSNTKYHQVLKEFLVDYPSLDWIQAAFMDDYALASQILTTLAYQESELMLRKKSLLSFGKLAYLASDMEDTAAFDRMNMELDLIAHHEDLPAHVLAMSDQKVEPLPVFLPSDLIKFYISDANVNATEMDFSKALDLLNFVNDEDKKSDLKEEIWCKAIFRNEWPNSNFNVTNVIEYLEEFLFFRILKLNMSLNKDMNSILPLDKLFEMEELNGLKENPTFIYLMKIGYEHYFHD